ncbi:GPP34 family phosphoprotein [Saccharopolyspora sp. HNM0983]|uniref:GPP34 family phosphoprotein n=1 Tax=Saccharopolyspora montiporae TaxID=2781240 RepID=A0A929BE77_9PSEU|nr:GPP34 family phosphoprotein [Saccharopolyspora sp. HNM0983]MBE9376408.1 GPP34 family phosphoprotein [Saccharopolyspora sp. HNM0983]
MPQPLNLAEGLALSTFAPEGKPRFGRWERDAAAAAGWLVELELAGRIELNPLGVSAVDPTPAGEVQLDAVLQEIQQAEMQDLRGWALQLLAHDPGELTMGKLVERGIVSTERRGFLWINRTWYPELDPEPRREFLRGLQLADGAEPDRRTAAALVISDAGGIDRAVFPDISRAAFAARVDQVTGQQWRTPADRQLMRDLHLAVRTSANLGTDWPHAVRRG